MYLPFYDLEKAPFQSALDPAFFWQGKKIHTLLKTLKFDFERHTRISIITGDPGCGKTSVIRAALDSLNPSVLVVLVQDSQLSVREFYDLTGHALELPGPFPTQKTFHKQMRALLQKAEKQGKHVLLVLDEAQQLSPQFIEEIEAIITLGTHDLKGVSVCLVGQLNDAECLRDHPLAFFKKYAPVSHHLTAMSEEETSDYIQHRLQVGGTTRKIFTDDALHQIHKHANGYPVQINDICDLALFIGESKQATEIDAALILANVDKLQFLARSGGAPTSHMGANTANIGDNYNESPKNIKPAEKQRISALEVFAQMDKDKEKQKPAPKRSLTVPSLGFCLILILGVNVYVYYNKWTTPPEGLPQVKLEPAQAKQPEKAGSQISVTNFTPAQELQTTSPSISLPNQVDKTRHLSREAAPPNATMYNSKNLAFQENHHTPRPTPLKRELNEAKIEGDTLVMPQLKEHIQEILQKTTNDLLQAQPSQTALEQEKLDEAPLLFPKEHLPQNKQESILPDTGERSQELKLFLAEGSFTGPQESENNKKLPLNERISIPFSSPDKHNEKKPTEPAPADVIDWLLKKKEQKIP